MNPEETKEAGSVNPLTGRTRTGGSYSSATSSAISANNVPMSSLTNTGPSLNMPTPNPLPPDNGVVAGADAMLSKLDAREAELTSDVNNKAKARSQSEQNVLRTFGLLQQEPEDRKRLEDAARIDQRTSALRKEEETIRQLSAELREFDRNNTNTIESMRVDASKRDITKRTFNAMSAEANIQMAVERGNKAADLYAHMATVDMLQGNLQLATDRIDKALKAHYDPIKMGYEMEMFFLQRNDALFSDAQKELSNVRTMGIERELQTIDRAQSAVDFAVSNGYARPDEVAELISLSSNPAEQIGLAQMITNRGASQMRDLQMQQMRVSMAASQATLEAKNAPNPMQSILNSLFAEDSGLVSFDDYLEMRTDGIQGPISPAQYEQLEQEYQREVAQHDAQDNKGQKLAFLVASGAITPAQADYVRDYIDIQSPKDAATAAESVRVAQTVARDIQTVLTNIQYAGSENNTLLEQIEGRRGNESQAPLIGEWQLRRTRELAKDAQPIFDLKASLESVASNMSMENLNQMRKNSPTGGALGNVSDKQSQLLSDLLGSTKLDQSPELLETVMHDLINFQYDVIYGHPTEIRDAYLAKRVSYEQAQQMLGARMSASPEMLGLSRDVEGTNKISSVQLTRDGKLVPMK
jgi:hypothetical protein